MNIKVVLDDGAYMPEKAHEQDAGFDLRTPIDFYLCGSNNELGEGRYVVDTGVHIEIPSGYVGMLKSKSGLNVKDNIISEGVIDCGYTGSIRVKLYNLGNTGKFFKKGDKITQLVIMPIAKAKLTQVESLSDTERGNNGFGSSGR